MPVVAKNGKKNEESSSSDTDSSDDSESDDVSFLFSNYIVIFGVSAIGLYFIVEMMCCPKKILEKDATSIWVILSASWYSFLRDLLVF